MSVLSSYDARYIREETPGRGRVFTDASIREVEKGVGYRLTMTSYLRTRNEFYTVETPR